MSLLICFVLLAILPPDSPNKLSVEEKQQGWQLLFDGTLDDWTTCAGTPSRKPVEDGCINPHGAGDYMLIHKKMWGNFTLVADFKISKGCNSGIFVRTFPLTPPPGKDVGWNGMEIAIDDTTPAGYVDTGALYDLARPTKNAMKAVGEWNHIEITCNKQIIDVTLNGDHVTHVDLARFTEPNKRPDGSAHKFDRAMKDQPRKGYIGLQDHGGNCWFKNIKLLPLPD